jgi:hypothetical protein
VPDVKGSGSMRGASVQASQCSVCAESLSAGLGLMVGGRPLRTEPTAATTVASWADWADVWGVVTLSLLTAISLVGGSIQ